MGRGLGGGKGEKKEQTRTDGQRQHTRKQERQRTGGYTRTKDICWCEQRSELIPNTLSTLLMLKLLQSMCVCSCTADLVCCSRGTDFAPNSFHYVTLTQHQRRFCRDRSPARCLLSVALPSLVLSVCTALKT